MTDKNLSTTQSTAVYDRNNKYTKGFMYNKIIYVVYDYRIENNISCGFDYFSGKWTLWVCADKLANCQKEEKFFHFS